MAEQLAYDVVARDRGAIRTLSGASKAMQLLTEQTARLDKNSGELADSQLKVRQAMLGVTKAEDSLADARAKLDKVTKDATASDKDKRKASLGVEAAEIRHARALRGVQTAGESAAKSARKVAAAQDENTRSTDRATKAARLFGSTAHASGRAASGAYVGVSKSIGGLRVGVGGLLKGAGIAGAAVGVLGGGILTLGKQVYDSAASLELMDRKARIVFGKTFPEVAKWAAAVGDKMGLTKREVIGLTAGVQDLLVPMGFTRGQAVGMSKDLIGLSGALSQWSGGTMSAQDVSGVLTAALLGERDALQSLGIQISQAQVDAQVLVNKKKGLKFASDEQAQAQATLDLVYAKSKDAQDAYANSTGGLAEKANKAKARFKEVRDEILVALIPALGKFGDWFLSHQDDIINFGFHAAAAMIQYGKSTALTIADILDGVGDLSINIGRFLTETVAGFARGGTAATLFAAALGITLSSKAKDARDALERMATQGGAALTTAGGKAKAAAESIRANVPPAADAATRKLEQVRRAALGIPNKTLTQLQVDERAANQKIAATKRALRDPELTKVRKAKLEADLAKWEAQKKQIARDKANLAKAVYVPAGATAAPGGVKVIRVKDKNGAITGIRFGRTGQGFATGGPVRGPGTSISDSIPARLSNDEHVLTAREVRGFGGHAAVMRMRKAAASQAPGFARGGPVVDFRGVRGEIVSGLRVAADTGLREAIVAAVQDALKREGTGAFNAGLSGALSFARSQVGKPYIWGGVGPAGYDCSGFMSALVNVAQGRSPYTRRFATGSLPAGLFSPGTNGAFSLGWFRGNPGHTAGTINGVNVESRGGDGVVVGPSARGSRASLFSEHGSLKGFARGGPVLPGDPPYDLLGRHGRRFDPQLRAMLTGDHLALANGGVIREPIFGVGASGRSYSFAERGPETVTPGVGSGGAGQQVVNVTVNVSGVVGDHRAVAKALAPALMVQIREQLRSVGRPGQLQP